jgi:hypothetical protein
MARWAWLLLFGLLLPAGCERGGDQSTQEAEASEESTSEQSDADQQQEDTGTASEGDRTWENQVQKALEEGTQKVEAGETGRSEGGGCEIFPDSCPEGEACFATRSGKRKCAEFNPDNEPGDDCDLANDCPKGTQCVGGLPGTCLPTCRPGRREGSGCPNGTVCTPVEGTTGEQFEWGACRPRRNECSLWPDDNCGDGEACMRTPVGLRCLAVDRRARSGDSCRQPRDCNVGQTCVQLDSGGQVCRDKCDPDNPCDFGQCAPMRDRLIGFCTE